MVFRMLGKTGWEVSAVGMGCWALGGQWGEMSTAEGVATVRRAFDLGVNLFDTADAYGLGVSEEVLGKAVGEIRASVFVATKVGNFGRRLGAPLSYATPHHVYLCCDASLRRLRIETIDLYQCHIGNPTPAEAETFLEAFAVLRQQGKIRWGGISTDSAEALRAFDRDGSCGACQLNYSLLNRQAESGLLPACRERNIGTLIRGPLAMGVLAGKFSPDHVFTDSVRAGWNEGEARATFLRRLEQVEPLRWLASGGRSLGQAALQFCLANPAVTCIIPGAKSPAQVEANVGAADGELSAADLERIDRLTAGG